MLDLHYKITTKIPKLILRMFNPIRMCTCLTILISHIYNMTLKLPGELEVRTAEWIEVLIRFFNHSKVYSVW